MATEPAVRLLAGEQPADDGPVEDGLAVARRILSEEITSGQESDGGLAAGEQPRDDVRRARSPLGCG
jgi:hypothetical protein